MFELCERWCDFSDNDLCLPSHSIAVIAYFFEFGCVTGQEEPRLMLSYRSFRIPYILLVRYNVRNILITVLCIVMDMQGDTVLLNYIWSIFRFISLYIYIPDLRILLLTYQILFRNSSSPFDLQTLR